MKKIITIALTLALALSLVACGSDTAPSTPAPASSSNKAPAGTSSEVPASTNTPDPASPQAPSSSTSAASDSTATSLWTGSYSGDGVKIRLYENSNGTVDATIEEESRHNPTLTISGNTATATMLVQPEAQGGDMALNDARNTFPNIDYSYTLTLDGSKLTYHRTTTLTELGELIIMNEPEQVMEFTATLSRNNTNK